MRPAAVRVLQHVIDFTAREEAAMISVLFI